MRHDEILGLIPRLNYGLDDRPDLQLLLLELLFWAVIIVVTIALVRFRPLLVEKVENRIRAISQHTRFWMAAFPLLVIVFRLAVLPWDPRACSRRCTTSSATFWPRTRLPWPAHQSAQPPVGCISSRFI